MRPLNIVTLVLIIIGGLNWLLVGLAQIDVVAAIFGGPATMVSRIIYLLVGLSAVWQLIPLVRTFTEGEVRAERG